MAFSALVTEPQLAFLLPTPKKSDPVGNNTEKNRQHLRHAYYEADTMLNTLYALSHLILSNNLTVNKPYCRLHFTGDVIEA